MQERRKERKKETPKLTGQFEAQSSYRKLVQKNAFHTLDSSYKFGKNS
jgi:hypothetical protein